MFAEKTGSPAPRDASYHRSAFFRQSGWMMFAATAGGAVMYAVHMVAKQMPKEEYGLFTTLLQVVSLMGIPAAGLQMVFAQQVASAISAEQRLTAVSTFRAVWRAIFFIWLAMAVIMVVYWKPALGSLKISNRSGGNLAAAGVGHDARTAEFSVARLAQYSQRCRAFWHDVRCRPVAACLGGGCHGRGAAGHGGSRGHRLLAGSGCLAGGNRAGGMG
jgi:hypothetical protein